MATPVPISTRVSVVRVWLLAVQVALVRRFRGVPARARRGPEHPAVPRRGSRTPARQERFCHVGAAPASSVSTRWTGASLLRDLLLCARIHAQFRVSDGS